MHLALGGIRMGVWGKGAGLEMGLLKSELPIFLAQT